MSRSRKAIAALAAALMVPAALTVARAAEPASGTVSGASPTVTWTGQTINSFVAWNAMSRAPEDVPCEAPTCDTFALTVAAAGDLEISNEVQSTSANSNAGIRVTAPDGTVTFASGASMTGSGLKLRLKGAKTGGHTLDLTNNGANSPLAPSNYKGAATLSGVAAPPPAATPTPTATAKPRPSPTATPTPQAPPSGPSPAPTAAPAPAGPRPKTGFTLDVTVPRKLYSRPLRRARRFSVGVTVGHPVVDVAVTLKRNGRPIVSRSNGALERSGRIAVPARNVRPGRRYFVSVVAEDADGVKVARSVRLRVVK